MSQADLVSRYYDENTEPFYLRCWDDTHLHFGLYRGETRRRAAIDAMTRAVVGPAHCRPEHHVVDAGCGVGGTAIQLATETGCRAFGLTLSKVQKDLAERRAVEAGVDDRVHFMIADCATHLPFDDASIDVVTTLESACHFADKPKFIEECARILRPGGVFVGSDWMRGSRATADAREALEALRSAWRLADLPDLDSWSRMLTEGGFDVVEAEDFGDDVLENARVAKRATLELMLEAANGSHDADAVELWIRQYETLGNAWLAGHFTIGRLHAIRRSS